MWNTARTGGDGKGHKALYRPQVPKQCHTDRNRASHHEHPPSKPRFWLTTNLLQAHSSFVVVDPKGGILGQVGTFLQKRGYKIKVFNSVDFSKSMHCNPLSCIKTESDILKFVNALIENTMGDGREVTRSGRKAKPFCIAF
jgi:hypothetical protein